MKSNEETGQKAVARDATGNVVDALPTQINTNLMNLTEEQKEVQNEISTLAEDMLKAAEMDDPKIFTTWDWSIKPDERPVARIKGDPIPELLKPHFFPNKTVPDLIKDYDVIGFDTGNTLVKYNMKNLSKLVIESILAELNESFGYPASILDFDYDKHIYMAFNGAVWDVEQGTVVKLSEDREVVHAYKGFEKIRKEEIVDIYADPPKFIRMTWPYIKKQIDREECAYWVFMGNFEACLVPVVCQLTEQVIQGKIKDKTRLQIAYDLTEAMHKNLSQCSEDQIFDLENHGRILSQITKEPLKYVIPQPKLLPTLKKLNQEGKKLFYATNSHSNFTDICMMATTSDPNWSHVFDLQIANCMKPLFFSSQNSFYEQDRSFKNYKGKELVSVKELHECVSPVVLEGNAGLLSEFYQETLNKEDIKVAYFGDHLLSDIQATHEFNEELIESKSKAKWDSILVLDELSHHNGKQKTESLLDHNQSIWGESYFYDTQCARITTERQVTLDYHKRYVEPNNEFFKLNGELEDQCSLTGKSQFLIMKSAQSIEDDILNEAFEMNAKVFNQQKLRTEVQKHLFSEHIRDAELNRNGDWQSTSAQGIINEFDLHPIVLCSPHVRTIQTAVNMLQTHPQKHEMKIRLEPMLKDIYSAADIIPFTGKELSKFIKKTTEETGIVIEWGEDSFSQEEPIKNDWMLDVLEPTDRLKKVKIGIEALREAIKAHYEKTVKGGEPTEIEVVDMLVEGFFKTFDLETDQDLFARVQHFKLSLTCLIAKQAIQPKQRMLIVTHDIIIKALLSEGVYDGSFFGSGFKNGPSNIEYAKLSPMYIDSESNKLFSTHNFVKKEEYKASEAKILMKEKIYKNFFIAEAARVARYALSDVVDIDPVMIRSSKEVESGSGLIKVLTKFAKNMQIPRTMPLFMGAKPFSNYLRHEKQKINETSFKHLE